MACVIKEPKYIFKQSNFRNANMATILIQYAKKSPTGEDFKILSMYFHYFIIICPNKKAGLFIWINFNILYQRMLCARFGWNWSSGSEYKYGELKTNKRPKRPHVTRVSETLHRFFARSAHLCKSTGPIIE